jgi:hypothetical protein
MKILYIYPYAASQDSSVRKKIECQIKSLNKTGAQCHGAFLSVKFNRTESKDLYITHYPVKYKKINFLSQLFRRSNMDDAIRDLVSKEFGNYDYFYIRRQSASRGLYRLVKKFGNKIVMEHQSKELDEIKSYFEKHRFGLRPTLAIDWWLNAFSPLLREKIYGPRINRYLRASISVTNEISIYQNNLGSRNSFVVSNGVATDSFALKKKYPFNNELNLLFLKGSSGYSPWNGFDRLISSIDDYYKRNPNGIKINLHVYGHFVDGEIAPRPYIFEGGFVRGEELDRVVDMMHIGVSGLAVYKKNFNEGASLKVREYVARGLPFFYAYTDPDINADADFFALKFPNDDSLIDMHTVIAFARDVLSDDLLPQKMREFARLNLDYDAKMIALMKIISNF